MDGSVGNLRLHLQGLVRGEVTLHQFQRWLAKAESAIEEYGNDDDVDLMNLVFNRLAEYTGDHIDAGQLLAALQRDIQFPLQKSESVTLASDASVNPIWRVSYSRRDDSPRYVITDSSSTRWHPQWHRVPVQPGLAAA